jgi:hypothetical protein
VVTAGSAKLNARNSSGCARRTQFNDLRARRFRYNYCDLTATLVEVAVAVTGFCEQIDRTGTQDWDRSATRLPGRECAARWLVRQAMHEGVHHFGDIRRLGSAVAGDYQ